ncbi:hypothetical protein J3Q64DRAFT_1721672 [Phycomyces blakesleeanus]|uniref:Protein JTB n=2 Tax=Phycomyces blakesleeanus TaxID=4837 RepID=A0A162UPD8_PHYB8|nr:hypothetical protein PHYBLDRAFT_185856 [Phycomyces blakesleeanus NRRL 1555(-)]OAD76803.1 hypothetical protein PHYBLDRAFT_185856 [Phycomyces blakesleeanus NRRL 1555(-)]|eukprot:XP_018294843.1 hypothetical protein PHYBLDRAFT_185856 [Phycomyces blakesleeanus NRRL 1555(-)]
MQSNNSRLLIIFLITLFLVPSHAFERRAPPPEEHGSSTQNLGDYTHSHEDVKTPTYSCISTGDCDVCTSLEKKTIPYCAEFGNKEPVRCEWNDPDLADRKNQTTFYDYDAISLPSFRSCPRVKRIVRWQLIQFESINLVVAVVSIILVIWRQRKLAREQYLRLAHRIGVTV